MLPLMPTCFMTAARDRVPTAATCKSTPAMTQIEQARSGSVTAEMEDLAQCSDLIFAVPTKAQAEVAHAASEVTQPAHALCVAKGYEPDTRRRMSEVLRDALGPDVEGFQLGDRVVGMTLRGAYAEKSCAPSVLAMPIPEGVSHEQAASCPVAGLTAHFLLRDNHVGPDTTLVAYAGAGSVGCFVGGLGKRLGCTSIALVSSGEKASVAKKAGYSHVVEYRKQEPVAAVRELFPEAQIFVEYSVPFGGFFCQVRGREQFSVKELAQIETRMRQIVAEDAPIAKERVPLKDAIELIKARGEEEKVKLLLRRQKDI